MKHRFFLVLVVFALVLLALSACGGKKVQRVSASTVTDLSGRWNDTDSQEVSKAVISDCLAQPWLNTWENAHPDKKPVVIVGRIMNKASERIDVETFVKDMQRALINSQKVRFVSSRTEREGVRDERKDQQQGYTSDKTRAQLGEEIGADFIVQGTINTILDEQGGTRAVYYQVNVELHNVTTNEIVWIGQKEIKKIIEN